MTRFPLLWIFVLCIGFTAQAQKYHNYVKELSDKGRWKQHVDYTMEVDVDVENFQYVGKQNIKNYNDSPNKLQRVFYHLFLYAFQLMSVMDIRTRRIVYPDARLRDRITNLEPHDIGYTQPTKLT